VATNVATTSAVNNDGCKPDEASIPGPVHLFHLVRVRCAD